MGKVKYLWYLVTDKMSSCMLEILEKMLLSCSFLETPFLSFLLNCIHNFWKTSIYMSRMM